MNFCKRYTLYFWATVLLGCSQRPVTFEQLQLRNSVYYQMNSSKPFTGKVVSYHSESAAIAQLAKLKNGRFIGEYIVYYTNGQIYIKRDYKKGAQFGNIESYQYEINGKLEYHWKMADSSLFELYDNNDKLKLRTQFKGGIKEEFGHEPEPAYFGEYQTYYPNGNPHTKANCLQGNYWGEMVFDGLKTTWYENGQKRSEGNYRKGEKVGTWTRWNENGSKLRVFNFDDGLLTTWAENNQSGKEERIVDNYTINQLKTSDFYW